MNDKQFKIKDSWYNRKYEKWDLYPFYVKCCMICMDLCGIFLNSSHYNELKNYSNERNLRHKFINSHNESLT